MFRNRLSRRNFLKKSSLGTLSGVLASAERIPADQTDPFNATSIHQDELVHCALIGFGEWGREIAKAIDEVEETELTVICDTFPLMLRRAKRDYPSARREADFTKVLSDPGIQAVFIATATHEHKDLVIAALEAGKHVYCEAPIAHTMEDARAIAQAARKAKDQIFQAGLLYRTEPQYRSVFGFVRSGALGKTAMVRSQWHYKDSWRRTSSSGQRAADLNWRLDETLSLGMVAK